MSPKICSHDDFEDIYREKFRSIAIHYGKFINYEKDRAAIDIGLHLTKQIDKNYKSIEANRIWFQLKGIKKTTLPLKLFQKSEDFPLDLKISDIKFWYASPEPIYIVVYVECIDKFFAEDIISIVNRYWGERVFNSQIFKPNQKKVRVRINKKAELNENLWEKMYSHRSMRIDNPLFRGRFLGHNLDPLRSSLDKMEPDIFESIINRLLSVHNYKKIIELDTDKLFPNAVSTGDKVSLHFGCMHNTYEWIWQMTNEFGFNEDSDYRIEGDILFVQGNCAVLVHSNRISFPNPIALKNLAHYLIEEKNTNHLLVFVNDHIEPKYFGSFFGTTRETKLRCIPQDLGDIAYNLLTTTIVYLEFRDKIKWRFVNYIY